MPPVLHFDFSAPAASIRIARLATAALSAAVLLMLGHAPLRADILANDNFTASSGTGTGTVENTSAPSVGTFVTANGTQGMSIKTVPDFGEGNVLALSNSTNTYYRAFDHATVLKLRDLPAEQTLSITFDIRFEGGSFAAAQNFSFGLVNTTAAHSILFANVNLNGGPSEFRYRPGSFNMSDAGTIIPGSTWTEPATVTAKSYTLQLDVTKKTNGSYLFQYFRNSVLLGTSTQTTTGTWARLMAAEDITGIAIRHSQMPALITYIDTVVIVTMPAAPEPNTASTAR